MKWRSRWLRGWVLVTGGIVLGAGVGAVSTVWLSGPAAAAVGSTLAAAVFGAVSARGKTLLDVHAEQKAALPEQLVVASASGRPQRVRDLNNPIALRVHPAETFHRTVNGRLVADRVPPYIRRDTHEQLWSAVARGGFVLLTGDSTAGKTRMAYEAIRALCPDHVLIAPASRESLATIVPVVLEEQRRCVVWLDDLERFLGSGGLTASAVGRILGNGDRRVLLLATLRNAEFDRYSAREEPRTTGIERDSWREARDVLDLGAVVELPRRWSAEELTRARDHTDDPRISTALGKTGQFGLAEVLAAGPSLARDWRNAWRPGAHPRGAALVAAAVDCRRAGVHDPQPLEVLAGLAEHHLAQQGGALLRPEPLADALTWATTRSHGTSSLLLPTDAEGHYLAFDYLIDLPGIDGVPQTIWDTLIDRATPQQAFAIGEAAYQRYQWRAAATAFRKAAHYQIPDADMAAAFSLGYAGDRAEAERMLTDILAEREGNLGPDDPATLRVRLRFAMYLVDVENNPVRAANVLTSLIADLTRVLGPDHPDTLEARLQHAFNISQAGNAERTVRLLTELLPDTQRALGSDHSHTLWTRHYLAVSLTDAGHFQRSIELATDLVTAYERILGADHPRTLQARDVLAWTIGQAGDPARAAEMFRLLLRDRDRVLGADHRHTLVTRYDLVCHLTKAGDNSNGDELFTSLTADLRRIIGVDCSIAAVTDKLVSFAESQQTWNGTATRRRLLELPWTCQHALETEHPLTKEIQQIITDSPPSIQSDKENGIR